MTLDRLFAIFRCRFPQTFPAATIPFLSTTLHVADVAGSPNSHGRYSPNDQRNSGVSGRFEKWLFRNKLVSLFFVFHSPRSS